MVSSSYDAEAPATREQVSHDHLFRVTGLSSDNLPKLAQGSPKAPADFEAAIAATSYGKFNLILMLCALPGFWSAGSVTSAVSYIFTRAKCHLHLSLLDMGTVNATTFAGMISSAMLWGFLSDTLGRKKIMVFGFIGSGLLEMAAALSQNFVSLLISRFFSGFLFNGPWAILVSYIAELHRTEYRARSIMFTSLFYTIGNTTLPLLAWAFLIHNWDVSVFGTSFVIHSWNVFLLVTALMPILAGLLVWLCLPESPKFLMSRGRNDEAMAVFKKMYSLNTGKSEDEYPVKSLIEERSEKQAQGFAALKAGFRQLAPLFRTPLCYWLILMCTLQVGCMLGANTLRLWFPQLAAMIETTGDLCSAITPNQTANQVDEDMTTCKPIETTMMTYLQSSLVGAGSLFTYGLGGIMVNKCGKKTVAAVCALVSALLVTMLPLLSGSTAVVTLVATTLALTALTTAALSSVVVDLFPTGQRVMALSMFLMSGRLGTVTGTVTFPALMQFGCLPPFFAIAGVLTFVGALCFVVPKTNLKKME